MPRNEKVKPSLAVTSGATQIAAQGRFPKPPDARTRSKFA